MPSIWDAWDNDRPVLVDLDTPDGLEYWLLWPGPIIEVYRSEADRHAAYLLEVEP